MTHNQRLGKATSKFLLGRNLFYFHLNPNLHSHNSHTGSLISNYIYYFLLVFERGFGSVEGEEGKLHFLTLTCPKLPTPLRRKVPTNNSLCRHSQLYFCLFKSGTKKGRMVTCASKAAIIYEAAWSLSGLPSSRFSSLCNYWQKCIPNFCEKKYCFQHSCNNSAMLPKDWGLMIEERCKKRFDHHLYITYMQSYNSKFGINTMLMTQCTESKLAPPGKNTQLYICKICRLVLL